MLKTAPKILISRKVTNWVWGFLKLDQYLASLTYHRSQSLNSLPKVLWQRHHLCIVGGVLAACRRTRLCCLKCRPVQVAKSQIRFLSLRCNYQPKPKETLKGNQIPKLQPLNPPYLLLSVETVISKLPGIPFSTSALYPLSGVPEDAGGTSQYTKNPRTAMKFCFWFRSRVWGHQQG